MRKRVIPVAALVVAVLLFGAGFGVGRWVVAADDPTVLIGGGLLVDGGGQLWAGGTGYNLQPSVAWRDTGGSEHANGRPACLTPNAENMGVRFRGWIDSAQSDGKAWVVWVDCSRR